MGGLTWIFDPGQETGWAMGWGTSLIACGLIQVSQTTPLELTGLFNLTVARPKVWIEVPEFRRERNQVDPNDLIALACKVGRIQERCLFAGFDVTLVRPSKWKGSIPKNIHHDRIRKALSPQELQIAAWGLSGLAKGYQHNVWDAIGLFLWAVRRERES